MSDHEIDYETLAQEALRGVVRRVLTDVAKSGLPGNHHFYVEFDTQAVGVGLSRRLRERYPRSMTIVLQHLFWDLQVFDDRFEVKLTFDKIPERLIVPYAAVKVFFDPSVPYALQFEPSDLVAEAGRRAPILADVARMHDEAVQGAGMESGEPGNSQSQPRRNGTNDAEASAETGDENAEADADENEGAARTAEIVSLDAFRKK